MALTKADLTTAKEYADMVKDEEIEQRIFGVITEEYNKTKDIILQITGQSSLLDHVPNIQESVRLRNPYVDPLNFLQVQLLSELRQKKQRRMMIQVSCSAKYCLLSTVLLQDYEIQVDI
ncbi:hypothetical protein GCM10020331_051890 [Ectobacillus funiculus]